MSSRLKFEDFTTIIVVKGRKRFKFYENEVKPENICCFQPYRSTVRDRKFKESDIEHFKRLFNSEGCLPGEVVVE